MGLHLGTYLRTENWRRSFEFLRAIGCRCNEPQGDEPRMLIAMQLNYMLLRIIPASWSEPPDARALLVRCDDLDGARRLLDRALAAGANQTEAAPGQLRFADPDGNTWILVTEWPR